MKKYTKANIRFGRLITIEPVGFSNSGAKLWLCKCDCGNLKTIMSHHLSQGTTRSCGCLRNEYLNRGKFKWKSIAAP